MIKTKSNQELKAERVGYLLPDTDDGPTLIELSVVVPAKSELQISYDFVKSFMRWTDFRPDANKGTLIGSAMIQVEQQEVPIYARPLLVILPTPDFSMPYNVLCIVSTILVLAFSTIHTATTRKPSIPIDKKKISGGGDDDHQQSSGGQ